jgi:uncharacterized membrane protein YsdA (DUF1294 family)
MSFFLSLPIFTQALIIYFICINIITFFWYGLDKLKAQWGSRRVSEKTLWILAFIGGSLGAIGAMEYFRHKTQKSSFQAVLFIIFFIQLGIIFFLIKN